MAELEEIASNGYNLNISRYVDTTEPAKMMSVEDALASYGEPSVVAGERWRAWTNYWPQWVRAVKYDHSRVYGYVECVDHRGSI